jgi:hypothetical protein
MAVVNLCLVLLGGVWLGIIVIYLFRILIKKQRECKSLHYRHYVLVFFFEMLCLGYVLYESFNSLYLHVSPVNIVPVDPVVNAPADLPEDERVRLRKKQVKAELLSTKEVKSGRWYMCILSHSYFLFTSLRWPTSCLYSVLKIFLFLINANHKSDQQHIYPLDY